MSSLVDKDKDDIVDVDEQGNVLQPLEPIELNMYIFSNNPNDAPAQSLLQLFYEGALKNSLGVMRAFNTVTGEEDLLLVGVEQEGTSINTYPLAKVLGREAPVIYKSPDGKGGWFEPIKAE